MILKDENKFHEYILVLIFCFFFIAIYLTWVDKVSLRLLGNQYLMNKTRNVVFYFSNNIPII